MSNVTRKRMNEGYNVALHGIRASEGSKEIAEQIMQDGLKMRPGTRSIRCTTVQLGDEYRNSNFREETEKYFYGYRFGAYSEGYNVIIMSPTVITNSKGETLFLGDPYKNNSDSRQNVATSGQEYESTCMLDCACGQLGKIPAEFVYGYVEPETGRIIKNPKHYSQQLENEQAKDDLFNEIKSGLSSLEVEISTLIANGNFKKLEMYKNLLKQMDLQKMLVIIENAEEQYADKSEYEM